MPPSPSPTAGDSRRRASASICPTAPISRLRPLAACSCSTSARARSVRSRSRTSRSSRSSTGGRGNRARRQQCRHERHRSQPHHPRRPRHLPRPARADHHAHLTFEQSREKYAPGTEFAMDIITMIGNTGTYLDSPAHRWQGGADLSGLDLETLVDLRAEVFHVTDIGTRGVPGERVLGPRRARRRGAAAHRVGRALRQARVREGRAVPQHGCHRLPHRAGRGARRHRLAQHRRHRGRAGERPAHSGLLAAGVHVVEHLTNLGALPPSGARFTAAPPKVAGFGTFPVRAFATL